jgi:hypothetical protein
VFPNQRGPVAAIELNGALWMARRNPESITMNSHASSSPHGGPFVVQQTLLFTPRPLDAKSLDESTSTLLNEREAEADNAKILKAATCGNCHWCKPLKNDFFDGECGAFPWQSNQRLVYRDSTCPLMTTTAQWIAKHKEGAQ